MTHQLADPASGLDAADRLADAISRAIDARPRKPWLRDPGLIISAAAFLASIVTSAVSVVRSESQDVNAKKDALHAIIQQYENNVIHSLELNKKENGELINLGFDFGAPAQQQNFGAFTKQQVATINDILAYQKSLNANVAFENVTLARQALSLVSELNSAASSVDLSATAFLLFSIGEPDFPERLYQIAIGKAVNSVEYLGATRGLAQTLVAHGRFEEARNAITTALDVFKKFPEESANEDYVHYTQFHTYMGAVDNIGAKDCALAREYLASAQEQVRLHTGSGAYLYAQLQQSEGLLNTCPSAPGAANPAQ